jgi:hypothetical protein
LFVRQKVSRIDKINQDYYHNLPYLMISYHVYEDIQIYSMIKYHIERYYNILEISQYSLRYHNIL